jgi:hypothetical protein
VAYARRVDSLKAQYQLTDASNVNQIDDALNRELLKLYLAGEGPEAPRLAFYSARWHWNLLNTDLRTSNAARLGYARSVKSQPQDPVTWEETLLRCLALLEKGTRFGTAATRA